jgi:hypothetical protein
VNQPTAYSPTDTRRTAYNKINENFEELYGLVATPATVSVGTGAPGAASGAKGSMYLRTDGGVSTTLYVREAAGAVVAATGVFTLSANPAAAESVTIGTRAYFFRTALVAANDILIGVAATNTLDNLIAAINGDAGAGTTYGTGTVAHPSVGAAVGAGDTMNITADTAGDAGNSIASITSSLVGSWGAATLTGGSDDNGSGWAAK